MVVLAYLFIALFKSYSKLRIAIEWGLGYLSNNWGYVLDKHEVEYMAADNITGFLEDYQQVALYQQQQVQQMIPYQQQQLVDALNFQARQQKLELEAQRDKCIQELNYQRQRAPTNNDLTEEEPLAFCTYTSLRSRLSKLYNFTFQI
ncbi:unnamed protein product [Ambrosiozyma monospora]|uniref:Unnamed protein product n=1 Tax=Ambrosiozyma monospora TaxID=43982 RepID=A0ACB5U4Z9_AMBMO|nr:unnamed protein product [Ambrosiozyma monospora]